VVFVKHVAIESLYLGTKKSTALDVILILSMTGQKIVKNAPNVIKLGKTNTTGQLIVKYAANVAKPERTNTTGLVANV